MKRERSTTARRKAMTSREWYWIQFKSWAAGRRCGAPLCLITNSTQCTARSRGWMGLSRWRSERRLMFSLYLPRKDVGCFQWLVLLRLSPPKKDMQHYLSDGPLGTSLVVSSHLMRRIMAKLQAQKSAVFNDKQRIKGIRKEKKAQFELSAKSLGWKYLAEMWDWV